MHFDQIQKEEAIRLAVEAARAEAYTKGYEDAYREVFHRFDQIPENSALIAWDKDPRSLGKRYVPSYGVFEWRMDVIHTPSSDWRRPDPIDEKRAFVLELVNRLIEKGCVEVEKTRLEPGYRRTRYTVFVGRKRS